MELYVKEELLNHINKNNILIGNQSGFRTKHSCESSLQLVVSRWKELIDQRKIICTVFLDFKRAFETIKRELLVKKLEKYGVTSKANEWLCSYLENRHQQVRVNSELSSKKHIKYGVPQGTVLGPLLFILYINDIATFCDIPMILNLFADDTIISVEGTNVNETINKMQTVLNLLEKWLLNNSLYVNTKKTKVMLFNGVTESKNYIDVKLYGQSLEFVDEWKYLGVIIDNELNFKKHSKYIVKKIGKKVNYFNRISKNISLMSRVTLYKTIIAPHFEYCPTIVYYLNETEKNKLQILQNRAMRIILKVNRYTHIRDMLDSLGFMSINQRLVYQNIIFIYKILSGMLPDYMLNKITFVRDIHKYDTRSASNIYVPTARTSATQNSLFYKGLVLYNSLPSYIRSCTHFTGFRKNTCQFVKQNFK